MRRTQFSDERVARQVDQACDRFEESWRTGTPPRIEEYIQSTTEPLRSQLLQQLLLLEVDLKGEAGRQVNVSEYLSRFPDDQPVVHDAFRSSTLASGETVPPSSNSNATLAQVRSDDGTNRLLLLSFFGIKRKLLSPKRVLVVMQARRNEQAGQPIDQLIELGGLTAASAQSLEKVVDRYLAQHDNDTKRALAAISTLGRLGDELANIDDPALQVALSLIGLGQRDPGESSREPDTSASEGSRYEVVNSHAQGGLGEVFVARDRQLNRNVALKRIREHAAGDESARSRFVFEAEVTGRLEHPGIVPVYGLGEDGDGQPYYAMRFVRGESLKDAIDRFHSTRWSIRGAGARSVQLRQLLGRFQDVCNAIHFAHSRGVLHRDLKPENVMLGHFGETLVVDWGLAKTIDRGETLDDVIAPEDVSVIDAGTEATRVGVVMGTPAYMSPEQAAGQIDRLSVASDVYSLGATLYYLLTGKSPFKGQRIAQLLDLVRRGEFPAPIRVDRRVGPELDAICLKAMALRPEDRYQSAAKLEQDIEQYLADQVVTALAESLPYRINRWVRANLAVCVSIMSVLLAGTLAAAITGFVVSRQHAGSGGAPTAAVEDTPDDSSQPAVEIRPQEVEPTGVALQRTAYLDRMNRAHQEWRAGNASRTRALLAECPVGLRNWEWHYLSRLYTSALLAFDLGPEIGEDIAFSSDGQYLVSSVGSEVATWDLRGTGPRRLRGHAGPIVGLAISKDNSQLVSVASGEATDVRIWDLAEGRLVRQFDSDVGQISAIAASPGGELLAGVAVGDTIWLWDLTGGDEPRVLESNQTQVSNLAFSPDGQSLAIAAVDGWKLRKIDSEQSETYRGHTGPVTSVAFSPDGRRVATAGTDQQVRLWEVGEPEATRIFHGHRSTVTSVAFSPRGLQLVSSGFDGTVRTWEIATGRETRVIRGHTDRVTQAIFRPGRRSVASTSRDGTVRLWDIGQGQDSRHLRGHEGAVTGVAFSADSRRLYSAGRDGTLRQWNVSAGRELDQLSQLGEIRSIDSSVNGSHFAAVSLEGTARIWHESPTRELISRRELAEATFARLSPDGKLAAIANQQGIVRFQEIGSGVEAGQLSGLREPIHDCVFSPDGGQVVTASASQLVWWELANARQLHSTDNPGVTSLAFEPHGRVLAAVCEDGRLRLWDAKTRELVTVRAAHSRSGTAIAFSGDGTRIATVGADGAVKLWTGDTAEEVLTLKSAGQVLNDVAFSPDSHSIAAADGDGSVTLWHRSLPTRYLRSAADDRIPATDRSSSGETAVVWRNDSYGEVSVYWKDSEGVLRRYYTLARGTQRWQGTGKGHSWVVKDQRGGTLGYFVAEENPREVVIVPSR